jgi:hypothetical protein
MKLQTLATAEALVLAIALALLVGGCATKKIVSGEQLHEQRLSEKGTPIAHVYVANWGVYLFKLIPIMTGDLDNPSEGQVSRFFTNNVRVDLLVDKVTAESRRLGGTFITDLQTRDRSQWLPWTLIFWMNEFEVSANASRDQAR